MKDYEKLGAFYLGREFDPASEAVSTVPLLYDAKDLTTHAVIIGMTGSGKTGLGVAMLEEAAIDRIPVIAIDPKGDLGNLALTFPKLAADDFEPWVDQAAATTKGKTTAEFAAGQAALWKKGLAQWDQQPERIQRLRDAAPVSVYTPGSSAGRPLSILGALAAPDASVDADSRIARLQATTTGLLNLLGIQADPLSSREHILLSQLITHFWNQGQSPQLPDLIAGIQKPPFQQIGIMALEDVYPDKDRFALAMRFNGLLASPGFSAWTSGEPLNAGRLFYTEDGRPRVSVVNIAHLSDDERMFVVTMLLGELLTWMRAQPGTGSLRAILYFDELFGFMPPNANPASKALLLTLLKQARAFGLGLVLSTQNPVDLDYKGLSNAGTWFIGRLQTPQDRERVLDGLQSASGGVDRKTLNNWLGRLGKRRFLLHNINESQPALFETRWVMSYLAGPMTSQQIARLTPPDTTDTQGTTPASKPVAAKPFVADTSSLGKKPVLDRKIKQYFLPACAAWLNAPAQQRQYQPVLLALVDVDYQNSRAKVSASRRLLLAAPLASGPVTLEWDQAEPCPLQLVDQLKRKPESDAAYAPLPDKARTAKQWAAWNKQLARHVRLDRPLDLWQCATLKQTSQLGESEADFRIRLQQAVSEERDRTVAKLRDKYERKTSTLRDRLMRAEQAIEREQQQAQQKKMDTAMSFGSALLGAFLGRKKFSASNARRFSTAARRAGSIRKEAGDVRRAQERADSINAQLQNVASQFEQEVAQLQALQDSQQLQLDSLQVHAKSSDIRIHFATLGWRPKEVLS